MLSLNTQTKIYDDRSAGKRLIPEVLYQSFPSCTIFVLFTAPLTNDLFTQTEGHWGGDFAIASDTGAVNMTALSHCHDYLAVWVLQHDIGAYKLWLPAPLAK